MGRLVWSHTGAEFKQAFIRFVNHRRTYKGGRNPLSHVAAELILARCGKLDEAEATDKLNLAVENGWAGIFDDDKNGQPSQTKKPFQNRVATPEEQARYNPYSPTGLDS